MTAILSVIKNLVAEYNSSIEFRLAIFIGLTFAIGLAPSLYWVYFGLIGWPHPYITHTGPLWATRYGDLLCWGNNALLCIFPIFTLALATSNLQVKRNSFAYFCLALPFIQVAWGILNAVFLLLLLE